MLKKMLFFIVAISVCSSLFGQRQSDFRWQSDNQGGVIITDYVGTNRNIMIPEAIDRMPVTAIGDSAFKEKQLTAVAIPSSVIYIGNAAFMDNRLTSFIIRDSVTSIGQDAFRNNQLARIEIPVSVNFIGQNAFRNNHLTVINIPNSITIIESGVFAENRLSDRNFIPNSVISIGELAFSGNRFEGVFIPDSVREIKSAAFSNNNLTQIRIGANVLLEDDVFGTDYLFNNTYINVGMLEGLYFIRRNNETTVWELQQQGRTVPAGEVLPRSDNSL